MTPDLLRKSPLVRYRSGKPSNLPPLRYAPCIRPRIPFFFLLLFDTWRWNRDRQSSLSFFLQKAKGNGTFSIKLSKSLVKRRQLQFRPLDHKYGIDVYKWPGSAKVTSASLPNIYIMVLDDKERKKALKDVRRRQLTSLFVRLSISLWNGPRREREREGRPLVFCVSLTKLHLLACGASRIAVVCGRRLAGRATQLETCVLSSRSSMIIDY